MEEDLRRIIRKRKPNNNSLAYCKFYGVYIMKREINSSERMSRFLFLNPSAAVHIPVHEKIQAISLHHGIFR